MNITDWKRVHFVGVGGIGVSAVAQFCVSRGAQVSGSDGASSDVTDTLKSKGIDVHIGHSASFMSKDIEGVIYTTAVPHDNPELLWAHEHNIPTVSYAEALGSMSSSMQTIAVSGTHGKTTTSAMLGKVCIEGGLKPTLLVGSLLKEYKSNFVAGEKKEIITKEKVYQEGLFITEACEYRRTFLSLSPFVVVITNLEEDHLDYYKDLADIQDAFSDLVSTIPEDGALVCDAEDPNLAPVILKCKGEVIDYRELLSEVPKLSIPGEHNRENAACALAVADLFEVDRESSVKSLEEFQGTWRRFEYKGETINGVSVYDDYAHHPTEVRATLASFREKFPDKKICILFQPHLYSRTKFFLKEFGESFSQADVVRVGPIYRARSEDTSVTSQEELVAEIGKHHDDVSALATFEEVEEYMRSVTDSNTILVTVGAGDMYRVAEKVLS